MVLRCVLEDLLDGPGAARRVDPPYRPIASTPSSRTLLSKYLATWVANALGGSWPYSHVGIATLGHRAASSGDTGNCARTSKAASSHASIASIAGAFASMASAASISSLPRAAK
jgi:hypothetical protein